MVSTFAFYAFGIVPGVLCHEAGHWLVCVILGIPVHRVSIGDGRLLLRRQIGTTALELHELPMSGGVQHATLLPIGRLAHSLICLGGPMANVAVIGFVALAASSFGTGRMEAFGPGIVSAQVTIIVLSLIPWRTRSEKNDGYQLIETLIRGMKPTIDASQQVYAEQLRPYREANSSPVVFSKASCRVFYERARFDVPDERVDAAQALLRELDRGELSLDESLLIIDVLIRRQVNHRDLDLGPRLEELAARAAQLAPNNAVLRVSRGAALLDLGRDDEAAETFAPVIAGAPSFSKALALQYLARAADRRADTEEACRLVDTAIETLHGCGATESLIALYMGARAEIAAKRCDASRTSEFQHTGGAGAPGRA